jgi:acyl-CoA synthetase (AMP-forming)/AMP-acid ligase II
MPFPEFTPTVPVLIRTLAARHADGTMIVLGEQRVSYAEAERRSAQLARALLANGVGKGTRVGLLMGNGPDWVLAWLAAARIGALVVPINTFYQPRELAWVLRHADVEILLMQSRFLRGDYLERLEQAAPELASQTGEPLRLASLPYLRRVWIWGELDRKWASPAPESSAAASGIDDTLLGAIEACVTASDPMVLIYSSGSAADPKGAVHTHGSVIRHAFNLSSFLDIGADDRVYSPMPFFWIGGFVFSLLTAMHAGAGLLCEEAFEPGATLDILERERATLVSGWPHYAKALVEHESFAARDLASLRAGNLYAVLPDSVRPKDPELRSNSLGMTETCGPHTIDRMDRDLPEALRGSFGRAVPGLEHKIVDPESGETLATGELGEICVRGYSLMQGLHKVPREETFDADGYYHTGDSGYFDRDGYLFFRGRLGEMIKTGGANVTPREVEERLETYEEVRQAHVVGVPDPDRGQNVVAAVILETAHSVPEDELRERLKGELSAYKVPRRIVYLSAEELPLTDSGKPDKRRLVAMLS